MIRIKDDLYDQVEKSKDSSHVRALTFSELKNMVERTGLVSLKTEHQDLEMELEQTLQSSLPNPEDIKAKKLLCCMIFKKR